MLIQNNDAPNIQDAVTIIAGEEDYGKRLDLFVSEHVDSCQRSRTSDLIKSQYIRVNSEFKKPAYKIRPGDIVICIIPPIEPLLFEPEQIPLDILFEDNDIIIINKQPGLVVHPAPGNWTGTLVNGLLYHYPDIQAGEEPFRPGIVHRLDKDTSGAMVIAKNSKTLFKLSETFRSREVKKEYFAVVYGIVKRDNIISDLPVGRHPIDRKKMSTNSPKGKPAETHFNVQKRFINATLLRCEIKTGRTHQIRVHCEAMGHPIIGDDVYSNKKGQHGKDLKALTDGIRRQMLHSMHLQFIHPITMEQLSFTAPLPADMFELLSRLDNQSL